MIIALGLSDDRQSIAICDNNSPQRIDWYSRSEFTRRFAAFGGGWVVILATPVPPDHYVFSQWW